MREKRLRYRSRFIDKIKSTSNDHKKNQYKDSI